MDEPVAYGLNKERKNMSRRLLFWCIATLVLTSAVFTAAASVRLSRITAEKRNSCANNALNTRSRTWGASFLAWNSKAVLRLAGFME